MSKPAASVKELCPEGNYPGVCTGVIELGTQEVKAPQGVKKQKKVLIEFELQGVEKESGARFLIGLRATNSSHEKSTLAKTLKTWLAVKNPKEYDLENLLGKTALIGVAHSEDGEFANITTIATIPKGMKVGKNEQELRSLFLDETYDPAVFNALGDKLKEKIMMSPEYTAVTATKATKPSKPAAAASKGKKK